MDVTRDTLAEIGAGDIPMLYVFNKSDLVRKEQQENQQLVMEVPRIMDDRAYICAKDNDSLEALVTLIETKLKEGHIFCELLLPYKEGGILNSLKESATIESTEYLPEGIKIKAHLSSKDAEKYKQYQI